MSYRLKGLKSISRELSRLVTREFEKAGEALQPNGRTTPAEAVHEARKHVKKIRAILRLVQKDLGRGYDRENRCLRAVAHRLAPLRDVDATAETLKSLRQQFRHLVSASVAGTVRKKIHRRQRKAVGDPIRILRRARRMLRRSAKKTSAGVRDAGGPGAMTAGLVRGYRRARQALDDVHTAPDDAVFHAWRRRVKDHWYHVRLMEGISPGAVRRAKALERIETWLGNDHDLVLLRGTILESPSRFGDERTTAVVLGCVAKYQAMLRRRALKAGEHAFNPKPGDFRKTVEGWLA